MDRRSLSVYLILLQWFLPRATCAVGRFGQAIGSSLAKDVCVRVLPPTSSNAADGAGHFPAMDAGLYLTIPSTPGLFCYEYTDYIPLSDHATG